MICDYCGSSISVTDKICEACGAPNGHYKPATQQQFDEKQKELEAKQQALQAEKAKLEQLAVQQQSSEQMSKMQQQLNQQQAQIQQQISQNQMAQQQLQQQAQQQQVQNQQAQQQGQQGVAYQQSGVQQVQVQPMPKKQSGIMKRLMSPIFNIISPMMIFVYVSGYFALFFATIIDSREFFGIFEFGESSTSHFGTLMSVWNTFVDYGSDFVVDFLDYTVNYAPESGLAAIALFGLTVAYVITVIRILLNLIFNGKGEKVFKPYWIITILYFAVVVYHVANTRGAAWIGNAGMIGFGYFSYVILASRRES